MRAIRSRLAATSACSASAILQPQPRTGILLVPTSADVIFQLRHYIGDEIVEAPAYSVGQLLDLRQSLAERGVQFPPFASEQVASSPRTDSMLLWKRSSMSPYSCVNCAPFSTYVISSSAVPAMLPVALR